MIDTIKNWLLDTFTSPLVTIPVVLFLVAVVGLFVVCLGIGLKSRGAGIKLRNNTKASELQRSGVVPGVQWPEPRVGPGPSMIVQPRGSRVTGRTRIVFVSTDSVAPTKTQLESGVDLTPHLGPVVSDVQDTQPIEVDDGAASDEPQATDRSGTASTGGAGRARRVTRKPGRRGGHRS